MAYEFQVTVDCADPHAMAEGLYTRITLADPEGNEFCMSRSAG